MEQAVDVLVHQIPHPPHHLRPAMLLEPARGLEPRTMFQNLRPDGIDTGILNCATCYDLGIPRAIGRVDQPHGVLIDVRRK